MSKYKQERRTAIGKSIDFELNSGETVKAEKIYNGWAVKDTGRGYDSLENLDHYESRMNDNNKEGTSKKQ